jgi:hypothetical protein
MERDINFNAIPAKGVHTEYRFKKAVFLICLNLKGHNAYGCVKRYLRILSLVTILICFVILVFISKSFRSPSEEELNRRQYFNTSSHKIKVTINSTFLIPNEYLCRINNPYLLIIVPSRIQNSHVREVIRATYASISRDRVSEVLGQKVDVVVRTLFLIGTSGNQTIERNILYEYMKYKDILQIDIQDTYYNLTAKLLHAFKWINLYCKHVTYILKADEDVLVNVGNLLAQLKSHNPSENGSIYGKIFDTSEHFNVFREGRWGVSHEEYPMNHYPRYAQGTSYTLTQNLVQKIVHSAQNFPYLHIEDVFITGILAGTIHGAEFIKLNGTSDWGDAIPNPCKFAENNRLAQHRMTPHLMSQTWQALMSYTITCKTYRGRTMKY